MVEKTEKVRLTAQRGFSCAKTWPGSPLKREGFPLAYNGQYEKVRV